MVTGEEAYLISVFGYHLLDGHLDQGSGDTVAAVVFARSQHGDVATHGPASVWFELADDHSDQFVIFV